MISRTRIALIAACVLTLALIVPAFVQAKPAKVSGELSARGYTVIALAASGRAKTVRAARGKFKLRPPTKNVTLQLRAPDGTYAGPIVVAEAEHGERAIVGIKAGAKLGRIEVNPADGYAELATRLPRKYINLERTSLAEQGTPLGAGNLGRVRVSTGGSAPGDGDLDGVPNAVDVDDDGDVILDRFDPESGTAAVRAPAATPVVRAISLLDLDLPEAVNANAPGLTEEQIEAALPSAGRLLLGSLGIETDHSERPARGARLRGPGHGTDLLPRERRRRERSPASRLSRGTGRQARRPVPRVLRIPTKTASARSFGRRSRATAPTRTRSRCGTERPATRSEPATS